MPKVFIAVKDDPEIVEICDTLAKAKKACEDDFDDSCDPEYKIYESELVFASDEVKLSWKDKKPTKKK